MGKAVDWIAHQLSAKCLEQFGSSNDRMSDAQNVGHFELLVDHLKHQRLGQPEFYGPKREREKILKMGKSQSRSYNVSNGAAGSSSGKNKKSSSRKRSSSRPVIGPVPSISITPDSDTPDKEADPPNYDVYVGPPDKQGNGQVDADNTIKPLNNGLATDAEADKSKNNTEDSKQATTGNQNTKMASGDFVEGVVCGVDDLKSGEMKEVAVGGENVLLVRDGDEFHALGAKCTHYGAPLAKGAYCNGRVRCPWHGACFNVKTGDIEDFPGLDSLHKYQVEVADGKVKVKADKNTFANFRRQRAMCKGSKDTNKSVLIVGAGASALVCAETLRQEGYGGKITMVTQEQDYPYDRIKLSKAMDSTPQSIALRKPDFYKQNEIDVLFGKQAVNVNTSDKKVSFADNSSLQYDTLVLATGGKPRMLPIEGKELKNVCLLRTIKDANTIAENAKGKNVVIIGSSFIGMEVAASLADKAGSVSVVDIIKVPFQLTLGQEVGTMLQKMHEEKGVKFYLERGIKKFNGNDSGEVTEAVLSDDTVLPADICILGVGVAPSTEFLNDSGIKMNRGFVTVNKNMETNVPGVYAVGDIAEFPLFICNDQNANVQHWQMAQSQGKTAGLNIAGKKTDIHSVPFFWTVQYGKSIRYTGYGVGYDDIVVHGDLSKMEFVAFYTKGNDVIAVSSLMRDPIVAQVAELFRAGGKITKDEIKDGTEELLKRLP